MIDRLEHTVSPTEVRLVVRVDGLLEDPAVVLGELAEHVQTADEHAAVLAWTWPRDMAPTNPEGVVARAIRDRLAQWAAGYLKSPVSIADPGPLA